MASNAYLNFIARVTGASDGLKYAYQQFLDTLTNKGLFNSDGTTSFFDILYLYNTQDQATALLNLPNNTYSGSNPNSLTFTANQGFTGDTNTAHAISSGLNTSTAVLYTQNSAHLSLFSYQSGQIGAAGLDTPTLSGEAIYPRFTDNNMYQRVNDNPDSAGFASAGDASGHYLGNRDSSTTRQGYRNAVSIGTYGVVNSQAPLNDTLRCCVGTTNGQHAISMISAGASMTLQQVTDFYNAILAFNAAAAAGFPPPPFAAGGHRRPTRFPARGPLTGRPYQEFNIAISTANATLVQADAALLANAATTSFEQRRRAILSRWGPRQGPLRGRGYDQSQAQIGFATASLTQGDATLSAAATLAISGTATLTQANQTLSAAAAVTVGASATLTQADQTLSAASTLVVGGSASLTQADQALSAAVGVIVGASAALTQADQALSATATTGAAIINASAALVQDDAGLLAAVTAAISASAILVQDDFSAVLPSLVVPPPSAGHGRDFGRYWKYRTKKQVELCERLEELEEKEEEREEEGTADISDTYEIVANTEALLIDIRIARARIRAQAAITGFAELEQRAKELLLRAEQERQEEEEQAAWLLLHLL